MKPSTLSTGVDCLTPQDADRSVDDRQPIYKSSLDRWKRYEPYLQPLIDNLGGWKWIEKHLER